MQNAKARQHDVWKLTPASALVFSIHVLSGSSVSVRLNNPAKAPPQKATGSCRPESSQALTQQKISE